MSNKKIPIEELIPEHGWSIDDQREDFIVFRKDDVEIEVLVYRQWVSLAYTCIELSADEDDHIHLWKGDYDSRDILFREQPDLPLEKNQDGFYLLENVIDFLDKQGAVVDHGAEGKEFLRFGTGTWTSPEGETRFSDVKIYRNTVIYTSMIDGLTRWFHFESGQPWKCPNGKTAFQTLSLVTCSCDNFKAVMITPKGEETKRMVHDGDWVIHPSGKTRFKAFAPQGACRFVVLFDEENPNLAAVYHYETKRWMLSPKNESWFLIESKEVSFTEDHPGGFNIKNYRTDKYLNFNFKTGIWSESDSSRLKPVPKARLNFKTKRWKQLV